jgi:hypothetical protein
MSEMNRDEWIEAASEYAEKHRTKPIHVLMADFAIEVVTLNGDGLTKSLQAMYDNEENVEITSFWDSGWTVRFGDATNGFTVLRHADTANEIAEVIEARPAPFSPAPDDGEKRSDGEGDRRIYASLYQR